MATPLQAPGLANLQKKVNSFSNTGPAPAVTTATGTGKTAFPTPANVGSAPAAAAVKKPSASPEGSLAFYLNQNGGDRKAALQSMIDFRNNKNKQLDPVNSAGDETTQDGQIYRPGFNYGPGGGDGDDSAPVVDYQGKLISGGRNDYLGPKALNEKSENYVGNLTEFSKKNAVAGNTNGTKTDGTSVKVNANPTSTNSANALIGKNANSVVGKAVTLESRLADAKARYGADDPRVQKIEKLLELKNSRANNSSGNKITTPTDDTLSSKISDKNAKSQVDEMEVTDRNKNLQNDRIDTAKEKTQDLADTQLDTNAASEKATKDYKDEFTKEYDNYKKQIEERENKLKADEESYRTQMADWKNNATEALANEQAGQQAEVTSKLGKLGASEGVMANAQNEIRNNAGYQKQRADLQKQYIDGIQSNIKEYQTMYNNLVKDKTGMTDSKRALAEQLTAKINENKEKINTIKQTGINEMFKPVETFQDARLEDSNNSELSSKQNSEAQYRWQGMDEQARVAKLKDALYNYDSSISRSSLTPADYEKAAKEGDITKAVAMLANTAKNLTKPTTGKSTGSTSTSSKKDTAAVIKSIIDTATAKGITTPEQLQTALASSTLSDGIKQQVMTAWEQQKGWHAPLVAGRTQAQQDADIAAYKQSHNIK